MAAAARSWRQPFDDRDGTGHRIAGARPRPRHGRRRALPGATAIPPPAARAPGSARSRGRPTTCASIRAPACGTRDHGALRRRSRAERRALAIRHVGARGRALSRRDRMRRPTGRSAEAAQRPYPAGRRRLRPRHRGGARRRHRGTAFSQSTWTICVRADRTHPSRAGAHARRRGRPCAHRCRRARWCASSASATSAACWSAAGGTRHMVSHNGTAGHVAPRIREFTYPFSGDPTGHPAFRRPQPADGTSAPIPALRPASQR